MPDNATDAADSNVACLWGTINRLRIRSLEKDMEMLTREIVEKDGIRDRIIRIEQALRDNKDAAETGWKRTSITVTIVGLAITVILSVVVIAANHLGGK